jgi:uncharacterized membrane protein YoaK (UPF0700 family)
MSDIALSADTTLPSAVKAGLLSFVAGFVDTVGFIAFFGLFTAHVTGNFVLIGSALIRPHNGVLAKLLALPVFVVVVALTTAYVRAAPRTSRSALSVVISAQMALLGAFALCGHLASPIVDADAPLAIVAGLLGVAAMGVQNAASRLLFTDLPPTTVMTGNVTQFAADATQWLFNPDATDRAATRARIVKLGPPVAIFALGAATGALSFAALSFLALVVPIVALATVLVQRHKPVEAP